MAKSKANQDADKQVLDLIKDVKRRKEEIARSERPNWKTNCSFSYDEGKAGSAINLHVETSVKTLILIAAFLTEKEEAYKKAAQTLGVESPPPFSWGNSPVADWVDDIKARLGKIEIASKRKKLEALETRLNAIVSPELRTRLELEAITAELD